MLTAGAVVAQIKPRVIQTGADAESIRVVDVGGRLLVTEPSGSRDLGLPAATRVDEVRRTVSGWIAAGHYSNRAGGELLLLEQVDGEVGLLHAPGGREGFRGTPAVFVHQGRLSAVAWLEGTQENDLTVRASRWSGADWSEPEIVSPAGPGAQLALRGATLADGSWLLVWAAVDGQDDDIWWARHSGAVGDRWSTPRRVHADNPVPDIMPSVVAVPGGALAAWSWYDGNHYRLRTSRFDGSSWSEPEVLDGLGATDATLLRHTGGSILVYRSVIPGAWHVVDFDPQSRGYRRAAVTADRTDPPVITWAIEGPHFDWPQPAFHWLPESHAVTWERVE